MTHVALDIGAGSKAFGRALRRYNPDVKMLVLCGEPHWETKLFGSLIYVISREKAVRLINAGRTGVYRIEAAYEDFRLPDESLDLVTINSPHPLIPISMEMINEVERCLKPGGLYFSSYPLYDPNRYPKSFKKIAEGPWGKAARVLRLEDETEFKSAFKIFPPGPILVSNIQTHQNRRDEYPYYGVGYIYSTGIKPRWQLWRKPL